MSHATENYELPARRIESVSGGLRIVGELDAIGPRVRQNRRYVSTVGNLKVGRQNLVASVFRDREIWGTFQRQVGDAAGVDGVRDFPHAR